MTSTAPAVLVVDRPDRDIDRGVRYRVRLDGRDVRPGLMPNSNLRLELDAGFHTVAVAGRKGRWSPPIRVLLAAGSTATVELLPPRLSRLLVGRSVPTIRRAAHSGKSPRAGPRGFLPPA